MPKWKPRPEDLISSPRELARPRSDFEVARLECRPFAASKPKPIGKIGFEVTIIGADGLESGGEERGLHRAQHLPDIIGKVVAGGGIAPVKSVGEQIILGDHVLGYAERMQDQGAGESGAVLAGGAVDHQRSAVLEQVREQAAIALGILPDIANIGLAHYLDAVAGRQRPAIGE